MFYIFHGDDTHSQQETVANLMAKMDDPAMLDLNTTRFEGVMPFAQLRQACDVVPFLAKIRLVIVKDLFASKPDKAFLDKLVDYLPQLPETTRLFFLESRPLRTNHRVLKLAQEGKEGYVKQFSLPEGGALERWIRQQVEQKGGQISSHAAHVLAANIGSELHILANEIEKLVLYKGETDRIETADVELLCPYVAEANIFDLVDALGNRNGQQAATLLQKKLNEGAEPFYLFSMFVRQFRLLILVKETAETGKRPPAISQELNLHSFVVGKLYQQCRSFSMAQLEQIYRHLLEIDVEVKTGQNDMITALNLLVAGLTMQ